LIVAPGGGDRLRRSIRHPLETLAETSAINV
jgi:hypothetical protein